MLYETLIFLLFLLWLLYQGIKEEFSINSIENKFGKLIKNPSKVLKFLGLMFFWVPILIIIIITQAIIFFAPSNNARVVLIFIISIIFIYLYKKLIYFFKEIDKFDFETLVGNIISGRFIYDEMKRRKSS